MKKRMEKRFKNFKLTGLGSLLLVLLFFVSSPVWAKSVKDTKIDELPPVVIKTIPTSGEQNVAPSLKELQIIFSKKMTDKSWSLVKVNDESFPKINGSIRYLEDQKTLVVPLQLEPNKDYIIWVNSEGYQNFKDINGKSAVPYLLKFHTKK